MSTRRQLIKSTAACLALIKIGLLFPSKVVAKWPILAFSAANPEETLNELFGDRAITETDKIKIEMPPGAENGAIVPITINVDLENIQSISLIAEKNPVALLGQFSFNGKGCGKYLKTRIKLAKSSHVIVVVDTGGALCSSKKYIEVLKGGCD